MFHYFGDNQNDDQIRRLLECDEPSLEEEMPAQSKAKIREKRMIISEYFTFFCVFNLSIGAVHYGIDKGITKNRISTTKKSKFKYPRFILSLNPHAPIAQKIADQR